MHGAPFPCPTGKASLLLVCAHAWEARPLIQQTGLRACRWPNLPFPLQVGEWQGVRVHLLLTGSGRSRAAMAVAAWLTEELRGRPEANGLLTPAVVVANFGTAGAYPDNQPVGQTVLISRVRDGRGESHYPERLLRWPGEEGECRTVPSPQVEVLEDDRGQPLFDMEAFGVAEATSLFLSSSHLLVGKCVCDHVGADSLDWKTLAERCQQDYERGAALFLDHARAHLEALRVDPRRQKGLAIAGAVNACLEAAAELALTVSQRRELAQHLRAHLARGQDPQEEGRRLAEGLALCPARGKSESKAALAALLVQLAPGGGPGATGRA